MIANSFSSEAVRLQLRYRLLTKIVTVQKMLLILFSQDRYTIYNQYIPFLFSIHIHSGLFSKD